MGNRRDEVEERKKGRRQREIDLIVVLWSLERLPLMQINTLMRKDQEGFHVKSYTGPPTSTLRKGKAVPVGWCSRIACLAKYHAS
jgi:hypothetical protein